MQRRAAAPAACRRHLRHRGGAGVQHRIAAAFDDAGLGGGDLLHRAAQILGVIQSDAAQHGGFRRGDDVGGIELAAHSHLAYHDVAVSAGEPGEGDGRDHLKLRGVIRHGVRQRPHLLRHGAQRLVGDHLAVDLHPLVEPEDIGRRVQTRSVACGAQHGRQHGTGGALAVGARHMDEFQCPLRMTQLLQQRIDALQPGFAAPPVHGVDIGQRLTDRHAPRLLCT